MAKKIKRWRGSIYIIKMDIEPPQGSSVPSYSRYRYTFKKGQRIVDDECIINIKRLFQLINPRGTPQEEADFIDSVVEIVPNKWWKTTMKFTSYVHTNGNPRMTAVDTGTGIEYNFSWADFWSIFNNIERGEITGIFTLKKHGAHVTARMIVSDEEKQAIDNGTW